MRLASRRRCVVLKCYAAAPAAIARGRYRRGWMPVEAQGCRRYLGFLAASVLDELNRTECSAFARYSPCELLENMPIDFCDSRELAPNPEPTKADGLRVGHAGADREGTLIDIEHA
jgi:hypothetical protein